MVSRHAHWARAAAWCYEARRHAEVVTPDSGAPLPALSGPVYGIGQPHVTRFLPLETSNLSRRVHIHVAPAAPLPHPLCT